MSIRLNDLSGIANIIKTKYGNNLYQMSFIFCFKKDPTSYFIFQEIQGMPIKRVVYHKENNSVTFVASWASWSSPYALVADANFEQIENWKDLQDRSRPYNSYIKEGGFNKSQWRYVDKQNRTEKNKKHKNKSDAFVEFRVDKIKRANFNNWGFELYSDTISIIGIISKYQFPYQLKDVEYKSFSNNMLGQVNHDLIVPEVYNDPEDSELIQLNIDYINEYNIPSHIVTWQGGSFDILGFEKNSEESSLIHSSGQNGTQEYSLESYWSSKEEDEENDQFDEDIADMIFDTPLDDEMIFDIGQRRVNLDFND